MIEIRYDPFNGKAIPDGKVEEVVNNIVQFCKSQSGEKEPNFRKGNNTQFSTSNIINELRLAVKEGRINHKYIVFKYHIPGKSYWELDTITCSANGCLSHWPEGFCDYNINQCIKLV